MRHTGEGRPCNGRSGSADEGSGQHVASPPVPHDEHRGAGGTGSITIDCAGCPARGEACDDCLVSVLLGPPQIDEAATAAIAVLAERGLVPPLRDPRGGSARAG
jgi:hypothetical protein